MNKLVGIILLFTIPSFGQQLPLSPLEEEAKTNKRLLPRYGLLPKSQAELSADKQFVEETLKYPQFNGDHRAASNHLISLGFNYLYKQDLRTAMYRFNQAYLLDSTNTDIYWGYGAFYMRLGNYEEAKSQYMAGLSINPDNTHLLTDMSAYFLSQYYVLERAGLQRGAMQNVETALSYLTKSFSIDNTDQNTAHKLAVCYWLKEDCKNAWKYYDRCKELGGQSITEKFTNDLNARCKRKK